MVTFESIKIKPTPRPICGGNTIFAIENSEEGKNVTNNNQTIHLIKRCSKCFWGTPVVLHDCYITEGQ